jgi:hypothetical protein
VFVDKQFIIDTLFFFTPSLKYLFEAIWEVDVWPIVTASQLLNKQDKSVASFCHRVAAWILDIFRNFYIVRNCRSANNSTTAEAREKISAHTESIDFINFFGVCLNKFKNN